MQVYERLALCAKMHSGNAAAMPDVRNAATFSFCRASRSIRITTAIFVSNCILSPRHSGARSEPGIWRRSYRDSGFDALHRPGMTVAEELALGVAGPGADHAFL